jgi:hypothetical protein
MRAENERLRGLLHTTFGHWLADDNPEELPETCAEIRAALGVHPGEPFTATEQAGNVNAGQPSRSVQRRIALQKGEPMPEFDGAADQPGAVCKPDEQR